ncbi:MAG: PKD domain-containing protein, partial [Candidatus Bathyarchaeia archaeon]
MRARATVAFDGGGSTDNVGIVSYVWDFGDSSTGTGRATTHIYTSPGTYT